MRWIFPRTHRLPLTVCQTSLALSSRHLSRITGLLLLEILTAVIRVQTKAKVSAYAARERLGMLVFWRDGFLAVRRNAPMLPAALNFVAALPATTSTGTDCELASSGRTVRRVRGCRLEPQIAQTGFADRSAQPQLMHCCSDPVRPRATTSSRTCPL